MSKSEKLSKEELVKRAKASNFFKNEKVEVMYGRTNGHFYYKKPPTFVDEHDTIEITRKDVGQGSGSDDVEYPFNQKETIAFIKELEDESGVQGLIDSGKLLKDDARKGVQAELEKLAKKED